MTNTNFPQLQVLRLRDVTQRLGLSRSTLYDKMSPTSPRYDPSFPRPFKLGAASIGWTAASIDHWTQSRMNSSNASHT